MCGSEAKTTDDPEVILGLLPHTLSQTHLEKRPWPVAKLGVASLATPIIAVGIAYLILAKPRQAYAGQFISPEIGEIFVVFVVASIIGTILSIWSLWRPERWPILAIVGLMVNGGFLLGGFQHLAGY